MKTKAHPPFEISAREIHLFVGGALAVKGFDALVQLFYYFAYAHGPLMIVSDLAAIVPLPLGVGILFGYLQAVRWTRIFLWIMTILGIIAIPIYCYANWSKARWMIWQGTHDMLVIVILLSLMLWGRSRENKQAK